ncbi:MAG: aminopeptidase P family protein [Candidatus Heimdallarchaeota archaeon]|nr:MAG: aminopeptidase P family protein [Candidatus Heimdallarchaeota archaeon]
MVRFVTKEKLSYLYDELENSGIDILYLTDWEENRNVNVKYLSGIPEDANLFIDVQNQQTVLIPRDFQLAEEYAEADQLINTAEFEGGVDPATSETLKQISSSHPKIGVLKEIPYHRVKTILDQVPDAEIVFNPKKIDTLLNSLRATKSSYEIALLKKSIKISNQLVDEIEDLLTTENEIKSEIDLAIFVETQMRRLGAQGIGFETMVASSARSWQIHTYPRVDPELPLCRPGLALIDFGVDAEGYTSDVTLPFVMGIMNKKMKTIVETVQQAHDEAIDALKDNHFLHDVAEVAFNIIEAAGFKMPHGLGHGIGLTVHDSPFIRRKSTNELSLKNWVDIELEEGMVFTVEPGIYEKDVGGFRLENDIIITTKGAEVVTNSHPIFIGLS